MKKMNLFFLCLMVAGLAFGQNGGLITDFTKAGGTPLVTRGDFVLQGTTLVAYLGEASDVVIPANLGITEIGDDAFNMATITSVVIPNGVQKIGPRAFNDCYELSKVTLPNSVKVIDIRAFFMCRSLINITLPDNLAIIGNLAFYDCKLDSLTIPPTVAFMNANAFNNNPLSSITMPANITYVEEDTYSYYWYYDSKCNFGMAYNENGKKAGTYNRGFGGWYIGASPPFVDIVPNTVCNATLQSMGHRHLYRVTIPPDQRLLAVSLENNTFGADMDIYDAAGEWLYENYSRYSEGINAKVNFPGGTYYIAVSGYGAYSLSVSTKAANETAR